MENITGYLVINNNLVSVSTETSGAKHDKFCKETGYGPAACMTCQLINRVREDERKKHGIL